MNKKGFKKNINEKMFIIGMLSIPITNFLIFWLYVNVDSLALAFKTPLISGGYEWCFDNFATLFKEFELGDSLLSIALGNTLIFFAVDILVSFPLNLLIAYFIFKKVTFYRGFRILLYLPCIIMPSVTVNLFKYIIAGNGPVSKLFELLNWNFPVLLVNSDYALWTIIFYQVFFYLGGKLILYGGVLNHVDNSVLESAKIAGANEFQELIYMIIPLMWPTLSTVLILSFVGLFGASGPILLFTQGGYNTTTLSYWIFDKVYYNGEYNYPSAVGLFFTLIGAPIALIMRKVLNKGVDDVAM